MNEGSLTTARFWAGRALSVWTQSEFQDQFDLLVPKARRPEERAIEIGAWPGTHLAALCLSHGYRPVAMDYVPEVMKLNEFFQKAGLAGASVVEADFTQWSTRERFEVVLSLGFIEHFRNWKPVLGKHWEILADNGTLLLGVPIMGWAQMWLRRRVYSGDQLKLVLESHNLEVMNLRVLREACRSLPGARILFAEHIWNMRTWLRVGDPGVRHDRRQILALWRHLARLPRALNISARFISPYAIVAVQKQA
jgi:SAM-dependent methyltransferase